MFKKWFGKNKDLETREENQKRILELETQLNEANEANLKLDTFHREMMEAETKKNKSVLLKEEEKQQPFNQKQIELFEKNLRELKKENEFWKEKVEKIKMESINSLLTPKGYKYRLTVEKMYSGAKYKEVLEFLDSCGIRFIDQLTDVVLKNETNIKSFVEAHKMYLDLKKGKVYFDNKIYILKGERLNKLYPKNRKLCTYLSDNYYEFADDIIDFDFDALIEAGFDSAQIREYSEKKDEYFEEFKVK